MRRDKTHMMSDRFVEICRKHHKKNADGTSQWKHVTCKNCLKLKGDK